MEWQPKEGTTPALQLAKVKAQEKLEPAAATGAPKAPIPNAVGCLCGAGITASKLAKPGHFPSPVYFPCSTITSRDWGAGDPAAV